MKPEHQKILLRIAKQAVQAAVCNTPFAEVDCQEPELNVHSGCFVTLENHGALRGCIGQFVSDQPLYRLVAEMAQAAAVNDARFWNNPIRPAELPQLHIDISVLSPLKKTDDPMSLRLGIDGIYITDGRRSGCFLPQVATETGWTKEEFLGYCCAHKAGLPFDGWKRPGVQVYLFTADVFGADWNQIQ